MKQKYKLGDTVWSFDKFASKVIGIQNGTVIGVLIRKSGKIKYMLSCARHPCHSVDENETWFTVEEALAQLKNIQS